MNKLGEMGPVAVDDHMGKWKKSALTLAAAGGFFSLIFLLFYYYDAG